MVKAARRHASGGSFFVTGDVRDGDRDARGANCDVRYVTATKQSVRDADRDVRDIVR